MGILRTVVQALVRPVFDVRYELVPGCVVGPQLVCVLGCRALFFSSRVSRLAAWCCNLNFVNKHLRSRTDQLRPRLIAQHRVRSHPGPTAANA